jgi:hypothetical protein
LRRQAKFRSNVGIEGMLEIARIKGLMLEGILGDVLAGGVKTVHGFEQACMLVGRGMDFDARGQFHQRF